MTKTPQQVATEIYGSIKACRCDDAKAALTQLTIPIDPDLRAELIENIQACSVDDPRCTESGK